MAAARHRQASTAARPATGRLAVFLAGWFAACLTLTAAPAAAAPETLSPGGQSQSLPASVDFDACARLALKQSPYFTKSALEIEVRRLDEKDSKSDYLPTVNLRAKYYLSQPSRASLTNPTDYSLDVAIDSYNPLVAHYGVKIRQLLKQVAILSHLKIISQGLKELGNGFLEMDALSRLAALQGQMQELAGRHLTLAQRRLELGEAAPLEVKIAGQEAEVAKMEKERLAAAQTRLQERLRSFLGLKPAQALHFDTRQGRSQVLGAAESPDWEKSRPRSFDARIEALKRELQSWNVTLARLRLLPGLTAAVQTPDPIALTGVRGYFFSVGLSWPVFDGFKRVRDISRQKTILAQADAEAEVKEHDFQDRWREATDNLKAAAAARRLARSQLELARLKERQEEIKFQGGAALTQALAGQRGRLEAEAQVVLKDLEHDRALLELRHLSGDLVKRYVSEHAWLP